MRYMRVRVTTSLLIESLIEGKIILAKCVAGLPEGSKFCFSIIPLDYIYVDFVFEHPSFNVLMMGNEIPLFKEVTYNDLKEVLYNIKSQVQTAEDAYGEIVGAELWAELGL